MKLIKRLNVNKLSDKSVSDDLTRELDYKLAELHLGQATIEEDWVVLRDKIQDTAVQLLGHTTRKKQDRFDENDEEIKEMLAEKNRIHRIYQLDQSSAAKKTAFTNIRRIVQTRLRKMQDSWLAAKADEIQKYAETHKSKRGRAHTHARTHAHTHTQLNHQRLPLRGHSFCGGCYIRDHAQTAAVGKTAAVNI